MLYADNAKLYINFDINSMAESLKIREHCIDSIKNWILQNLLMLNDEKLKSLFLDQETAWKNCHLALLEWVAAKLVQQILSTTWVPILTHY